MTERKRTRAMFAEMLQRMTERGGSRSRAREVLVRVLRQVYGSDAIARAVLRSHGL